MNVYARTTVTRTLLQDGFLAFIRGEPVRHGSVRPWRFLGVADGVDDIARLARMQAAHDARETFTQPLAGGYAYDYTAQSEYVASRAGPSGLRWFVSRGPRGPWVELPGGVSNA